MKAFPPHTRGWTRFISLRRRRWLVSPHTRGWTFRKGDFRYDRGVSPAHAGMEVFHGGP